MWLQEQNLTYLYWAYGSNPYKISLCDWKVTKSSEYSYRKYQFSLYTFNAQCNYKANNQRHSMLLVWQMFLLSILFKDTCSKSSCQKKPSSILRILSKRSFEWSHCKCSWRKETTRMFNLWLRILQNVNWIVTLPEFMKKNNDTNVQFVMKNSP